ncbi:MAG TPA: hypothetical protein PKN70_11875 [Smithellaceae bacterium]|nr:hypothetical protein [Smithellaceae bacterium]
MPVVKYRNEQIYIPWDADKVANLVFQGYEVQPDAGISPSEFEFHKQELDKRLRKLWGNKDLVPARPQEAPQHIPKRPIPPSTVIGEDSAQAYRGGGVSRNVLTNPYARYLLRQVDPGDLTDSQNIQNFPRNIKDPIDL